MCEMFSIGSFLPCVCVSGCKERHKTNFRLSLLHHTVLLMEATTTNNLFSVIYLGPGLQTMVETERFSWSGKTSA